MGRVLHARQALLGIALTFTASVMTFASGCSGGSDCDGCGANGACVDDGTGARCYPSCSQPSDCPANFHCAPTPGSASKGYCVADRVTYGVAESGARPWGRSCLPGAGLENPECDLDHGFLCHAERPSDANAYCTQFDCQSDDDCGGGFYCEHINNAPNWETTSRSFGIDRTLTACLKRTYCTPCEGDVECEPIDGLKAVCVAGTDGKKFCTKPCDSAAACRADATCEPAPEAGGATVCKPRAGMCRGDGSFCSPCFSDFDCPDGICFTAPYSNEKACTVTSQTPCAQGRPSSCPREVPGSPVLGVACATQNTPEFIKDSCVPFVAFLQDTDGSPLESYGCWAQRP